MYTAHISIVRKEIPPNNEFWGKYENQEVGFFYSPNVHLSDVYCWLNCFSKRLEEIRVELGLSSISSFPMPEEGKGFDWSFHMTIGNFKELDQPFSMKYLSTARETR